MGEISYILKARIISPAVAYFFLSVSWTAHPLFDPPKIKMLHCHGNGKPNITAYYSTYADGHLLVSVLKERYTKFSLLVLRDFCDPQKSWCHSIHSRKCPQCVLFSCCSFTGQASGAIVSAHANLLFLHCLCDSWPLPIRMMCQ